MAGWWFKWEISPIGPSTWTVGLQQVVLYGEVWGVWACGESMSLEAGLWEFRPSHSGILFLFRSSLSPHFSGPFCLPPLAVKNVSSQHPALLPHLPSAAMPPALWWETDPWYRTGLEGLEKWLGSSYYFLLFQRTGIWLPTPRSGHSQSPEISPRGSNTVFWTPQAPTYKLIINSLKSIYF